MSLAHVYTGGAMKCSVCNRPMRKVGDPFAWLDGMVQRWRCSDHPDEDEAEYTVDVTLSEPIHKLTCTIKVEP